MQHHLVVLMRSAVTPRMTSHCVFSRLIHMIQMHSLKGLNMTSCATALPAKTFFGNQQASSFSATPMSAAAHKARQANLLCAGLYGRSTIREVDALTGKVLRQQALPARDFGEGMTKFGSRCE